MPARSHSFFPVLATLALAGQAMAQGVLQPGTSMLVEEGTSLRLPAGMVWSLPEGAVLINDGVIGLAPGAAFIEAQGSAIQGNGTEVSRAFHSQPLQDHQSGGLGLAISTAIAPDSLTVVRGHSITDAGDGRSSVARWFTVQTGTASPLNADLLFSYQDQELGLLDAAQLRIHRWEDGAWEELEGASQPLERNVTASGLDQIGTITLFEMNGDVGLAPTEVGERPLLYPTVTQDVLHITGEGIGPESRITIVDQAGRTVHHARLIPCGMVYCLNVSHLAPGAYFLRTELHGAMPFFRQ